MPDSTWFNMSNDLLCAAGAPGYFTVVNDEWTRRLRWTRDELLSRPFVEFVEPDDLAATIAAAETLQRTGAEIVEFETGTGRNQGSGGGCSGARDLTEK
jgi:rsbT co-antagonist protein RsbR